MNPITPALRAAYSGLLREAMIPDTDEVNSTDPPRPFFAICGYVVMCRSA
jgi:hypothetical protein